MTMTASYVRPDRVYSTGVVAPYPIRTDSPVTVARTTVNPFVAEVRETGPTLSGADPTVAAYAARRLAPVARPSIVQTSRRNVVAELAVPVPQYLRYLNRAARAGRMVDRATARGSVGAIIKAKQRQLRMLGIRF